MEDANGKTSGYCVTHFPAFLPNTAMASLCADNMVLAAVRHRVNPLQLLNHTFAADASASSRVHF